MKINKYICGFCKNKENRFVGTRKGLREHLRQHVRNHFANIPNKGGRQNWWIVEVME